MDAGIATLDQKVLVLNRCYAAVHVVPARQAFTLLCRRTAEIIAVEEGRYTNYDMASWMEVAELQRRFEPEQHAWLRLPRFEIAVPKIVRLLAFDRLPRPTTRLTRRNLYARDRSRCQYCGQRFSAAELTLDHVVPRVQGGCNSWENLVCACLSCNTRKGGRTPREANMKLIRRPFEPKARPAIRLRVGPAQYHSWKAFLNDAYWSVELHE